MRARKKFEPRCWQILQGQPLPPDTHESHVKGEYLVHDVLHTCMIPASAGDYVMEGPEGEHYPIRASVFADTYTLVHEPHEPHIVGMNSASAIHLIDINGITACGIHDAVTHGFSVCSESINITCAECVAVWRYDRSYDE